MDSNCKMSVLDKMPHRHEYKKKIFKEGETVPIANEETDPNNLDQHTAGAKMDSGKIHVSLLKDFGLALMAMAELATTGERKYSRSGWTKVEDGVNRYDDAGLGHILRENFEAMDTDTNIHHAVAAFWNAGARLQLMIEEDPEWKDRLMSRRMP